MAFKIAGWIINGCLILACLLALYIFFSALGWFFLADFGGRDEEDGSI